MCSIKSGHPALKLEKVKGAFTGDIIFASKSAVPATTETHRIKARVTSKAEVTRARGSAGFIGYSL